MKIFAHVDENNKILGWYNDEIHSENMPANVIEVSSDQYKQAMRGNHNFVDGNGITSIKDFRSEAEIATANAEETKLNKKIFNKIISDFIDEKAQSFDYDDLQSCLKYVVYDNPFKAECERLLKWNQACWEYIVSLDIQDANIIIQQLPDFDNF